ncbi:MAG: OFA family MFS transporter [Syntrophomonadaceae bacterium]|nr:OFA family MFS transporter [Syntrophomonadaceae bacterium]
MNRWLVVLGAVIVQLCLGAVYAWSLFNQPLIDKFGWERADVVLTFSITIATMAIFTIIAGKIQDKIGPRWVATGGGILLGLGLILASNATSLTQLYIFYGLIGGAGIGTAYVCPLATCLKWFPDKRGLISGIAVAGFGAGSLVFKPLILSFIASFGVSATFLYLGIIYLVAIVLGAQLLVVPPANYVPEGWTPPAVTAGGGGGQDFTPGQMLKTMQFYALWLMYLFGCMAGLMIIGLASNIGTELVKLDAAQAANAVVTVAIFNAAGRIIWGPISDKIGRINSLLLMYILAAFAMFSMSAITMNYVTFLALCSLIGFCFGGFLALFPSITTDYYGTKNLGTNYGIVFLAYGSAAILGPIIGTSVAFTQAFLIAGVLCAIGAAMTFLVRKSPSLSSSSSIAA